MDDEHVFTRQELIEIFEPLLGKTLGEADSKDIFFSVTTHRLQKGIAGKVIECSVLGYPANSSRKADLVVDGVDTEAKTTGLRVRNGRYYAKEPISVTGVSPETIWKEEFYSSHFWKKLEHLFLVYYRYLSDNPVSASEYADFPIVGYQFHEFDDDEVEMLRHDWETVKHFFVKLNDDGLDRAAREEQYPKLGSTVRRDLMLIDTSPRWPNPPRFRLKPKTVTAIVNKHFGDSLEQLPGKYSSYDDIDAVLHGVTQKYRGRTIGEIADSIGVSRGAKNLVEQIFVKLFGAKSKKMSGIELFSKIGVKFKSVPLRPSGIKKEDTKMFQIDFDWFNDPVEFEDSFFYDYFAESPFIFVVSQLKDNKDAKLADQVFLGFKRLAFSDEFIETEVRRTYDEISTLVVEDRLELVPELDKDGNVKITKSGVVSDAPNFPKSETNLVFVRGSGKDATVKPEIVNGLRMYRQWIWVHGKYIVDLLDHAQWV